MDATQKMIVVAVGASLVGGYLAPTVANILPASLLAGPSGPMIVNAVSTAGAAWLIAAAIK